MKIAIAGTGYVGLVAGVCFADKGYNVTCVDVDESKVSMMRAGKSPIFEEGLEELMQKNNAAGTLHFTTDYREAYRDADAIFIGVGTPELPDGSANLNYIAHVSRQIAETIEKDCLVVVKSTVPVGTNDKVEQFIKDFLVNDVKVEVASNPEFLAQGTAVHDTLHAARIIIGTESKEAETKLLKIYEPFGIPIVSVKRRSAEMIKYAANDFLALKISYMNDIANLCELVGADITDVAEGMRFDERIGSRFLNAGIGYGGSCFPKDTKALDYLAKLHGYRLRTVEACVEVNNRQKTRLFEKAKHRMITFDGLKVAILGLAYKPGTDDMREAPAIENINLLLAEGAHIVAYDPIASERAKTIFPPGKIGNGFMSYCDNPLTALHDTNICFVYTEWKEICEINPNQIKEKMHTPLIYDGRNVFDPAKMAEAGIEYYSIGR